MTSFKTRKHQTAAQIESNRGNMFVESMPHYNVCIRGIRRQVRVSDGNTIRHLRAAVVAAVAALNDRGVTRFQAQAIYIFGNEIPTGTEIDDLGNGTPPIGLNDATPLNTNIKNYTYTAFEVFTTVPTVLLRTVKLNEIHPVVNSDPGNQFTHVSPLFCAALSPSESVYPPFHMQSGRVMVRGASLFCRDESIPATVRPAAAEVEATEPIARSMMRFPLDHMDFQGTYQVKEEFGVLHTSLLYQKAGARTKEIPKRPSGNKKQKRNYFWRYMLQRGTDLSSLGVSLIFDKASTGHFTLIPNQLNDPDITDWSVCSFDRPHLWVPRPAQPMPPPAAMIPRPMPPPVAMPESISCGYHDSAYVAYLLVAKKFLLHDLIMKAAALELLPDGTYEDGDCQKLAQAAEVVFYRGDELPNSYELYDALAVLSSYAYNVKKMSFYDLGILRYAMTEVQDRVGDAMTEVQDHEEDAMTEVQDPDDQQAVLSLGVKVIDSYFDECASNSPRSVLPV
jgi:hypothetical protein